MKMKNAANLITLTRIVLAVAMLFLPPLERAFIIVYFFCGLTDVLDGAVARKTHMESKLGSQLDSTADFILMAVLIIILYPMIKPSTGILLWVGGIALIRFAAVGVVWAKFGTPAMLHTLANKVTGIMVFLLPLSLVVIPTNIPMIVLCIAATLSATEEILIDLTAKKFLPDRKSIFLRMN